MRELKELHLKGISQQINDLGGAVGFRLFNKRESIPNLYGETKRKAYSAPFTLPAFVNVNPTEDMITEAGLDKNKTKVIVKVARSALIRVGLVNSAGELRITTDDVMVIGGVMYDITAITPAVLFNQHQLFAFGGYRG